MQDVIAYQGVAGAYSDLAARRYAALHSMSLGSLGMGSFRQVVKGVESEAAPLGLLPVENTTAGSINEVYDLLASSSVFIVGDIIQPVEHCLLVGRDSDLEFVSEVYSHPQALAQCGEFFQSNPSMHPVAFFDTAAAANMVSNKGRKEFAAIASEHAAREYGLKVVRRGLADQKENYTRMVIVSKKQTLPPLDVPAKVSLAFSTKHEQGALIRCLALLSENRCNLTKIESRPKRACPWEYLFYVDFEGHLEGPGMNQVIAEMKKRTTWLRILGCYERGDQT